MKNPISSSKTLLAVAVATLGTCLTASAQLVQLNSGNPTEDVNALPTATIGAGGYDLFDTEGGPAYPSGEFTATGNLTNLPSYVSGVTEEDTPINSGGDSQITVAAESYTYFTGVLQNYVYNNNVNSAPLAKIVLQGTVPSSFDLGLLADNLYADGTTLYSLSLYNGATNVQIGNTLSVNSTATGRSAKNDFYFAEVSDPNPLAGTDGDYLIVSGSSTAYVSGQSGNNPVNLGGLTFDVATTPEPSSYALMLGGLGLLAFMVRRSVSRL
jgi:hypothetical protein